MMSNELEKFQNQLSQIESSLGELVALTHDTNTLLFHIKQYAQEIVERPVPKKNWFQRLFCGSN